MRRLLCALVIASAAASGGCPKPPPPEARVVPRSAVALRPELGFRKKPAAPATPEQEAVFAVLDAEATGFTGATKGLTKESPPSAVAKALAEYAAALDTIDPAPAPESFRAAFERYRTAVHGLHQAVRPLPDSYTGTQFADALSALQRGDSGKGRELGGDVIAATRAVTDGLDAVYAHAAPFGIDTGR